VLAFSEGLFIEVSTMSGSLAKKIESSGFQNAAVEYHGMTENSPINIMFCDKDLTITYMNPKSVETLLRVEKYLPVPANRVVGSNIDIFHKNPAYQRRLLASPKNLPHRSIIQLGPERLDLLASAIYDKEGNWVGVMATWDIVTEKLQTEEKAARMQGVVENAPINIMYANLDGIIEYVNPRSLETLKSLEKHIPIRANEVQGQSYDIFHKNPSFQRKLLADDRKLPHRAQIQLGDEVLDLRVSATYNKNGEYTGPMLTWDVITEKLALETNMARAQSMVDNAPINIMMADRDLNLVSINKASHQTLTRLQRLLPKPVDQLMGQSIDIFHKNPAHQRALLSNERNLPHHAQIRLGDEHLELNVSATYDKSGAYIGPMITWEIITDRVNLVQNLKEASDQVASAAEELNATSAEMRANARATEDEAAQAASASEQVTAGVQQVAHSSEELRASIREIAQSMNETSRMVHKTLKEANEANVKMNQLATSSQEIGDVIKVINSIAQQTNLLALNATIEAARAGDAGRGFSVVANEVKELANQTAAATEEITRKINTIQVDTRSSVEAIKIISESINKINEIAAQISAAVQEQNATTDELTRISGESSTGVNSISKSVRVVSETAGRTSVSSTHLVDAAKGLTDLATRLNQIVKSVNV
jgi:methyl-accepting chemotaxis protein